MGYPDAATTRVVQMDPGPTPTLTASTPATIKRLRSFAVATFPASGDVPVFPRIALTVRRTSREVPCACRADDVHSRLDDFSIRSPSRPHPDAARRGAGHGILAGFGVFLDLEESDRDEPFLVVASPPRGASRSGSCAGSPGPAPASSPGDGTPGLPSSITFRIGCSNSSRNEGPVGQNPASLPSRVTGSPDTYFFITRAPRRPSGPIDRDRVGDHPDSDFFTRSTRSPLSALLFRWRKPDPPLLAMAIAVTASVTVSIAEDGAGCSSDSGREVHVDSTSFGMMSDSRNQKHLVERNPLQHPSPASPECSSYPLPSRVADSSAPTIGDDPFQNPRVVVTVTPEETADPRRR